MRLTIALDIPQTWEHTYLMNGAGELDSERALNGAPGHAGRVGLRRWMESRTVPGYVGRFHTTTGERERKGVGGGREDVGCEKYGSKGRDEVEVQVNFR